VAKGRVYIVKNPLFQIIIKNDFTTRKSITKHIQQMSEHKPYIFLDKEEEII
jgi:hypothetical protein